MVQWLGLCAFTAEGMGSVPGQGTKILQAMQLAAAKKKKKRKEKRKKTFQAENETVATSKNF